LYKKTQKVSITSDATLWAALANCRQEIFARQFYELLAENVRESCRNKSKRHASVPDMLIAVGTYRIGHSGGTDLFYSMCKDCY